MSRLEDLIQTLCPDGVEYRELAELADIGTGNSNRVDANDDGKYPFFVRSKQVMRSNKYDFDEEAIVIPGEGGIGDIFHYVNGKYDLHQRAYRISFRDSRVNTRFAYYFMMSNFKKFITMKAVTATVISIRMPMIASFLLPIPPLPVQEEIVRILDTFSGVVAELEQKLNAEQAARVRQYEHYRNELLSFDSKSKIMEKLLADYCPEGVEFIPLKQVLDYSQPTPYIVKSTLYDDSYDTPVLTAGASFILGYTDEKKGIYNASHEKPVIIFDDFTTSFHWVDFNFKVKSSALKILTEAKQKIAVLRYVFYAMQCIKYQPSQHARQWIQTYSKIQIPLPPLPVQEEIVSILDRFNTLVNDLKSGLPGEIALRRKQYEYYRDKLLTFPQKPGG